MFSLNLSGHPETILVVNDIPGAGRVAGSINLPVLAAAQLEAAILPTLILSSHAGSPGDLVRYPMGKAYKDCLIHWQQLGYHFDSILTGYFSDTKQIDDLRDYFLAERKLNPNLQLIMDPIMGDHGQFYPGFDQEVAGHLRELIQYAEIVMPNLTEACLILDRPYREDFSRDDIAEVAHELLDLGAKIVILTGAREHNQQEDKLGFYYASQEGQEDLVLHQYFDGYVFGTGDAVISLVAGAHLAGSSLADTVQFTADIVEKMIPYSLERNNYQIGPIHMEAFLAEIANYFADIRK